MALKSIQLFDNLDELILITRDSIYVKHSC